MDEKEFKTRTGRLEEIAKTLEKLPPEVRSDAFGLLKDYVIEYSADTQDNPKEDTAQRDTSAQSEEEFFAAFDHDKPSDNTKLIAAWFYKEYGVEPCSLDEVREKADAVDITIPGRVDKTLSQATDKGKKLFVRAGKGKFRPTVHGEANLKATYNVKKGTQKREGDTE